MISKKTPKKRILLVCVNQVKKNTKLFGLTALSAFFIGASLMSGPAVARDKLNYKCDSTCIENSQDPMVGALVISGTSTIAAPPASTPTPPTGGIFVGNPPPTAPSGQSISWWNTRAFSFISYMDGAGKTFFPGGSHYSNLLDTRGSAPSIYYSSFWAYDGVLLRSPFNMSWSSLWYQGDMVFAGSYYVSPNIGFPSFYISGATLDKYQLFYGMPGGAIMNGIGMLPKNCVEAVNASTPSLTSGCTAPGFYPVVKEPLEPSVFTLIGPSAPYDKTPLSYSKELVADKGYSVYSDSSTWTGTNNYWPDSVDIAHIDQYKSPQDNAKYNQETYHALRSKVSSSAGGVKWFLPADDGSISGKGWFVTCDKDYTPEITGNGFATYETAKFMCMRDYNTEFYLMG